MRCRRWTHHLQREERGPWALSARELREGLVAVGLLLGPVDEALEGVQKVLVSAIRMPLRQLVEVGQVILERGRAFELTLQESHEVAHRLLLSP